MSTTTRFQAHCDGASLRMATALCRNAVASALWVLLAIVLMAFSPVTGLLIAAAAFPYTVIMTALSVAAAGGQRTGPGLGSWLVCVVAAWALTAPVANWYDQAMLRMDPGVTLPEPPEFFWGYWPWALPAVLAHAGVGIHVRRREARRAGLS